MQRLLPVILALGLATLHPCFAADTPECRNGSFPDQQAAFGLAKIIGTSRAYLRSDTAPCPDDSAACRGHAYVVPGDTVVTGMQSGNFTCVLYPGAGGGSAGYLRNDEIAPRPTSLAQPLSGWRGTWRDGDNTIELKIEGAGLTVSGEAFWPSANPSPKLRPGGPNTGELDGTAVPSGNSVTFGGNDPAECRATVILLPPYLLVHDNKNCGGMNVSFTGVYRRR